MYVKQLLGGIMKKSDKEAIATLLKVMVETQTSYTDEQFKEIFGITKQESMKKIVNNVIQILNEVA